MEEKIKELKDLGLAYKVALNYDAVQSPEDVDEVEEFFKEGLDEDVDTYHLHDVLTKYDGYSTGDIESKVFNIINQL